MKAMEAFEISCPTPILQYPNVLLAHGGGGRLMHQLIESIFMPVFDNPLLESRHDGAVFRLSSVKVAFTTDSYVVQPIFFPGGDIGQLSVNGTVNDLAMCGARPLYLSAGFILEEGLPMPTLWRVVQSMRQAADAAGVNLITGDTKVVDKGKGDQLFINTAGIGVIEHNQIISPAAVRPGDTVLLSGDIGRHGIAIMAAREGLAFESSIESDCAALADLVAILINSSIQIHCMRDLTRGGLASALIEIAEASATKIGIEEAAVPVREDVQGACEILGLDPLYLANEGRFIAFVPPADAEDALAIIRAHPLGSNAQIIGRVSDEADSNRAAPVTMKSKIGATRIVDMFTGEQLPRIC
jgi:hydrogenase expression/formation protein HypE